MRQVLLVAALAALIPSLAFGQAKTIDQLSAGGAITGTEKVPMFQTANPAVTTTPNTLDTYLSQTSKALTNKTINCSNNTCTNVSLATGVTGNLPVANLNSGTSASSSTFWRGDGTWATPTTAAGASIQNTGGGQSTTSAAFVMMGLGTNHLTPVTSGKVLITLYGWASNSTNADGGQFQIRYGTGTAPANGDASTGTACGSATTYNNTSGTNGAIFPFSVTCVVSGLTLSTAYWIDGSFNRQGGGTNTSNGNNIVAVEIP